MFPYSRSSTSPCPAPLPLHPSPHSSHHESILTEARVRLVCNEVLIRRGTTSRLPMHEYLRVREGSSFERVWGQGARRLGK